ncbi:YhdP family protein [Lacimicrobium sp. SS2-24]|uniref:YhdP family protein n=1 Tax=Lacimicrobium sp. SS2-24 TaxID=2005569 RepID=UPI000B4BDBEB|nr:YhdP family protein [Lacimicrobium sp. SS2-24]
MTSTASRPAIFYLSWTLRKLWTLSAIVLLSLAVLLSLLRLALPHMDDYKHWLERYISEEYGANLQIGSISATWKGSGPAIVLQDIALNNQLDSPIQLNIEETQIELDFWSSLLNRRVQSQRFNLNRLTLALDIPRLEAGSSDYPVIDALKELFLEQLHRFSVNDSELFLATDRQRQQVHIEQLSWLNKDNQHQGVGLMRVAELTRNSTRFILDLEGGRDDLSGTFYADAKDLDISPWVEQVNPSDKQLVFARVNMTFWADIYDAKPTSLQVDINDSRFRWQDQESLDVQLLGGTLHASPVDRDWHFALDNLQLQLNQDTPILINLAGKHTSTDALEVHSEDLQLASLMPLSALLMPSDDYAALTRLAPQAQLSDIHATIDGHRNLALTLAFEDFSTHQSPLIPGLSNVDGRLDWHHNQGRLHFDGASGVLNSELLLGNNLDYDGFYGDIYFTLAQQQLDIVAPKIRFESDKLNVTQALAFHSHNNSLSLLTEIDEMAVADARHYFPGDLMGQQTQSYLERSLVSGQIEGATLLWHGPVSAFPFSNNDGIFQASVSIADSEFDFDANWPSLTELDMQLLFENERLTMTSESGKLQDLQIGQINAVIPRLVSSATLSIDIDTQAQGRDVAALMNNSQMADSLGKVLEQIRIEGELSTRMNLSIPLTGKEVVASGQVSFANNPVYIENLELSVEDLTGELTFNNDQIAARDLTARLFEHPVDITLEGQQKAQHYRSDIELKGDWDIRALLNRQGNSLADYVEGSTKWQADLALILPPEGYQYEFYLRSDMAGFASALPDPFAKPAEQEKPLIIDVEGDELVSNVRVLFGDRVRFNGLLPHKEMRFSRAHLALGDSSFTGMGTGFSVSANLPFIDAQKIIDSINALIGSMGESGHSPLGLPERIFINAERMNLYGGEFDRVEINVKHTDLAWLASVNSSQSRADIEISHDWRGRGVRVEADYLNLPAWQQQEGLALRDSKELPPIEVNCQRCNYAGHDLGQVRLKLVPARHGMQIQTLDVKRNDDRLSASGDWFISPEQSRTQLAGKFESEDFGGLIRDFGFDAGVRDSSARMDFDLSWQQAPFNFNFATINGDVDWELGDGYLTEVSDKGARIFSILSLESLIRKLTLDFRDVFAKGFFYDQMSGTFQIEDGLVSTEDTMIDGSAGKMTLAGYTDLNTQAINYNIGFTPKVTSSLPVILAWMINTPAAIAALAIDEVLTSAKVISNIKYSLTGTLDKPVLEELGRDSREIQLPAKTQPEPQSNGSLDNSKEEAING